ncbi:MAG: DUF86 domain-containing protein [Thermoplasmata archaeon]
MRRNLLDYLTDILNECTYLLQKSRNLSYQDFIEDDDLKRAFVRSLEVIGEAAKKIPEEVRKEYPQIPWREVAGMRDKLIHEYFGVNYRLLWNTVKNEIPILKEVISTILVKTKE